jgi:hypothetical protein
MQLPKFVAAGVCVAVLGAQLWVSLPISNDVRGWYWPFLPYPMYGVAHKRSDSFIVPELRVAACGSGALTTVLGEDSLGSWTELLNTMLIGIARDTSVTSARHANAKLSRAIDAQFPGRYCTASMWLRVVSVADTSTHHVSAPMRLAATWSMRDAGVK